MFDFIFPRRCVFCRCPGTDELCPNCKETLPWRSRTESGIIAPLYYRETVRFALHRYKFRGFTGYAVPFGRLMAQAVRDSGADVCTVTWIPCSFWRWWTRGYDQSEKLARAVGKELGLPVTRLLVRTRHRKPQTAMPDDGMRWENVQGVFMAADSAEGLRILLIDDIHTSGATMDVCRSLLIKAGAESVIPCVLAIKS
jgi:ComF family protein